MCGQPVGYGRFEGVEVAQAMAALGRHAPVRRLLVIGATTALQHARGRPDIGT